MFSFFLVSFTVTFFGQPALRALFAITATLYFFSILGSVQVLLHFNADNKVQLIGIKTWPVSDNLQSRTYSFQKQVQKRRKLVTGQRGRWKGGVALWGGCVHTYVLVTHLVTCSCCTGKKLAQRERERVTVGVKREDKQRVGCKR